MIHQNFIPNQPGLFILSNNLTDLAETAPPIFAIKPGGKLVIVKNGYSIISKLFCGKTGFIKVGFTWLVPLPLLPAILVAVRQKKTNEIKSVNYKICSALDMNDIREVFKVKEKKLKIK